MVWDVGISKPTKRLVFMLLASNIILTIFLTYFLTILWVYRSEYKKKVYNEDFIITQNIAKIKFASFKSESLFSYLQILQNFYENLDLTLKPTNQNITKYWFLDRTQAISQDSWETLKNISSVVESISSFSPICIFIQNQSFSVSLSQNIPDQTCKIPISTLQNLENHQYLSQVFPQNNQFYQHICLNFSGIFTCYLQSPAFPNNLIISQNLNTIWHHKLKPTIPLSEYSEEYFLSSEEKVEFIENFFISNRKPSSFKYLQKGSEK